MIVIALSFLQLGFVLVLAIFLPLLISYSFLFLLEVNVVC